MEWIPCEMVHGYIINDKKLWNKDRRILVTYITRTGRRNVMQVWSERGKIKSNKVNGEIIAWGEMPEPYKGGGQHETSTR